MMKRKNYLLSLCLQILLISNSFSQSAVKPIITDNLKSSQSAKLTGYVGEKLNLSYKNRILAQDADRLVAPFRRVPDFFAISLQQKIQMMTSLASAFGFLRCWIREQ